MGMVGCLGDVVFSVSRSMVRTFEKMKWESGANYAVHERHLKDALVEYVGMNTEKISFSMYFSVFLGVNPLEEIAKLLSAELDGRVMRLVIGNRQYGRNKWVIEKITKEFEEFDGKGNLLSAKINISLLSYAGG